MDVVNRLLSCPDIGVNLCKNVSFSLNIWIIEKSRQTLPHITHTKLRALLIHQTRTDTLTQTAHTDTPHTGRQITQTVQTIYVPQARRRPHTYTQTTHVHADHMGRPYTSLRTRHKQMQNTAQEREESEEKRRGRKGRRVRKEGRRGKSWRRWRRGRRVRRGREGGEG